MNVPQSLDLSGSAPLAIGPAPQPPLPDSGNLRDRLAAMVAKAGHLDVEPDDPWLETLAALLQALRPKVSDLELLEALPAKGIAQKSSLVLNTLAALGFSAHTVTCRLNEVDNRLLPALFVCTEGRPFVIETARDDDEGSVIIRGPTGFDTLGSLPSPMASGTVWTFQRYDEGREPTSRFLRSASGRTWLGALLTRFYPLFGQILVAGCLVNVIALGVPLTIMLIYDRVIGVGNPAALPMLAVGLALTLGFEWWMRTIRSSTLSWFSGRLDFVVGTKIFERLLDLPPEKTQKASVSAQVARVKTFESVRDFFASAPFIGMLDMPFVVIGLAAIFIIAGPLAFVPLCAIAVYAALFLAMRGRIKPAVHIAARTSSARQQFAIDALEKLIDIRSLGLVDKWSDKYRHLMGRETMAQLHLKWLSTITETLAQTVTTLAAVATVGFGVLLVWSGSVSAGALVASILIVWRILGPFYWLSITVARSEQLRNSNLQIDELMELEGETEYSRRLATMPRVLGRVSFQDVAVRPADAVSDAFRGLSFHAEPGDAVALVGADGIDKGLVLKLLHSLQRPSAGVVQLDGFDLRQLNPRAVRRQVAYVPQRPEFLGWSVAENLRLVHAFATDEALWDALELADASEDVRAMPDGIDTILDGSFSPGLDPDLSARLGLARGYLQPGNVLLVDDLPNSVLTGQAGANFKAYIAAMKGLRTIIYCSQRDDCIRLADTIVYLQPHQRPVTGDRDVMLSWLADRGDRA